MANGKILIVDYEPRGIQQLQKPLENAGYVTAVVKDGLAAIEVFQSFEPDLTLIEGMLPKKGGFEVCQELKQTPHGMKSPIVIVTGVYRGRKYRTQALHHYGADEFLEKPIDPETLLEAVRRLLPERKAAPPGAPPGRGTAEPEPVETEATIELVGDDEQSGAASDPEQEISERLDELLSSDGGDAPSKATFKAQGSDDKVLPFEPRRVRQGRDDRTEAADQTGFPGGGGSSGGGARAIPVESAHGAYVPRTDALPDPAPMRSPAPRPRAADTRQSGRRAVWIGIAFVVVSAAVTAAVLLLAR